MKIFLIGIGGACGAMMRYAVSGLAYHWSDGAFPVGTLVVNLTGSLIIGFLWGAFEGSVVSVNVRSFLFVGILGGYTTFSTFALESFSLLRSGERAGAVMNILLSNIAGIVLVFAGYVVARLLITGLK